MGKRYCEPSVVEIDHHVAAGISVHSIGTCMRDQPHRCQIVLVDDAPDPGKLRCGHVIENVKLVLEEMGEACTHNFVDLDDPRGVQISLDGGDCRRARRVD